MDLTDVWGSCDRRIAEYFVICGLPENPKFYNYDKVIEHSDELIIPDKTVDFTAYAVPIIDIQFVCLKDRSPPPLGYHAIRFSRTGKHKASIRASSKGDEFYLCYRRGREKPPITNISMYAESAQNSLKPGATKITTSWEGKSTKLSSLPSTYLSYTRASPSAGIDELAVIDICIIFPNKRETCPPAYIQLDEPLTGKFLGDKAYLCFRKSLVKEHTIAYQPKILFWYRVPPPPSFDGDDSLEEVHSGCMNGDCNPKAIPDENPDIRQVAEFCLPWGAMVESWSVEQDIPQMNHFSFVLTNETGKRLYGVAFTFHEPYDLAGLDKDKCYRLGIDPELIYPNLCTDSATEDVNPEEEAKITARQKHFLRSRVGDRVVGVTKALCLLSRWPFRIGFANFLAFLYSRCFPGVNSDSIPLERYLTHFLCEVPFPDRGTPSVLVELCAAPILLESPDNPTASSSCEPFFYLLSVLGVDLTINLFVHMLTEQKILMTSVQHFLLTQVGEALTSMIFPLQWAVVYIPFIYMGHMQVIQSPSPYLIGVDSRFFDFFRLPSGFASVTYVDLDTRNFKPAVVPGQPVLDVKLLPKKLLNFLRSQLRDLYKQIQILKHQRSKSSTSSLLRSLFSDAGSEIAQDTLLLVQRQWLNELSAVTEIGFQIKQTFINCMAHLLRGYDEFVLSVREAECEQFFNVEGFLDNLVGDDRSRPLYELLFGTQHWVNFIRDRTYASPRDEELSNFDNLIASLVGQYDNRSSSLILLSNADTQLESQQSTSPMGSSALQLLVQGRRDSIHIRSIGPPTWPISDPTWTDAASNQEPPKSTSFDLVPTLWNYTLLDRLALYSYRVQLSSDQLADVTRLPLNPILTSSSSSLNVNRFNGGVARPGEHLRLLASVTDSPSPSLSRSVVASSAFGLTGLPADYPLPVKNGSVLRRSALELRLAQDCAKRLCQYHDLDWAKYLVGSMYSLWFILFPSYLSALYTVALQSTQGDSEEAISSLNKCLTEAVNLYYRLCYEQVECEDQVIGRILLSLIYQNRPPDVDLDTFLDYRKWNLSSIGLANHIYEAHEKERKDAARIKMESERQQTCLHHRRSASASCMMAGPVEKPSLLKGDHTKPPCVPSSTVPSTTTQASHPHNVLTHKRSNSSTVAPSTHTCSVSKSETDSGLHLGCAGATTTTETSPHDERAALLDGKMLDSEMESPLNDEEHAHAPLASLDEDLTDLGYSTLHRPSEDSVTNVGHNSDGNAEAEQNTVSSQVSPTSHVAPPLEPVQRPPTSEWIEQQSTEYRPPPKDIKTDVAFHLNPHQNGVSKPKQDSESVSTDDSSDEGESSSHHSSERTPYRPGVVPSRSSQHDSFESSNDSFSLSGTRGSLGQLGSALASLRNSDLPNKFFQSFRGILSFSNRSSSNTPNPGRRMSVAERFLPSTPNSSRIPRDMGHWRIHSSDVEHAVLNGQDYADRDERQYVNDAIDPDRAPLEYLQHLWLRVGGNLTVTHPHQRHCPATIPTLLQLSPGHSAFNPVASLQTTVSADLGRAPTHVVTGNSFPEWTAVKLYLIMTTCNCCPHCHNLIHDEELMSSWTSDDENYQIRCVFCEGPFLPQVGIRVMGLMRGHAEEEVQPTSCNPDESKPPKPPNSTHSTPDVNSSPTHPTTVSKGLLEFTHPYMSPLTLRKTLENIIHREGDECLRSSHPKQSLLFRYETLTWNLVWYTYRLGLPSHLLDHFPIWLMERQSQGLAAMKQAVQSDVPVGIQNSLMNVVLSPDLPVLISLRWNEFQVARGIANQALYKQWLRRKSENKSQWMLVSGKPSSSPILSSASLNLSASSSCPLEATMARVIDSIRENNMHFALDAMVQFRASVHYNKPIATLIAHRGDVSPAVRRDSRQHAACTHSHHCASCLKGSLYRELLFLTICILRPITVSLVRFDLEYTRVFEQFRKSNHTLIDAADSAPDLVASACRQMLLPLSLNL